MNDSSRRVRVYADWAQLNSPALMGLLSVNRVRGKEVFSFAYDAEWLSSGGAQQLDPDLTLFEGPHYLRDEKSNFGLFLDSSPDRWGRLLMRRREACYARRESRRERPLAELDYLLGVYDGQRMGALRFQEDGRTGFLNCDAHLATPPLTSLRDLEHASLMIEEDEKGRTDDTLKWIDQLLAPGSSLGGARPKAGVMDEHGSLWIAKFPSRRDETDVGAWEAVVNELARMAGLRVPNAKSLKLTRQRHTYLSRRFDRLPNGERIHFASAMTLLGYADGADAACGAGYLELAEFIMQNGNAVAEDLAELWRRLVFNICVSNTDDHLRNHGFLLAPHAGWRLAPAYDMNPNPQGTGLTLNISENDNRLDLALAMEVANAFRLSLPEAKAHMAQIRTAVGQWRQVAARRRIAKAEQDELSPAFQRGV